MNTQQTTLIGAAALAAVLLAACAVQAPAAQPAGQGRGVGNAAAGQATDATQALRGGGPAGGRWGTAQGLNGAQAAVAPAVVSPSALTDAERAGLVKMREEEKLARDVYQAMYAKWGLNVFANIAQSEQTHMDAVKQLLDANGVADPAAGKPAGVFTDPELQSLYDGLVAKGNTTLGEALKVGATIEDLDIVDLVALSAKTARSDIAQVYANLRSGSENHLRAFASQLQATTGESYAPQYLSAADYAAIVGAGQSRGPRWNR